MHLVNRHSRMLLAGIQVLPYYKLDSRSKPLRE
jgi:hypothetical protein